MKHVQWWLSDKCRLVGLPGWLAAGLLVCCAVVAWGWLLPAQDALHRLEADNRLMTHRLAEASAPQVPAEATPQQALSAFTRRFSSEKTIGAALTRLQAAAKQEGIALDQAEFKFASEPGEPLSRYALVLPVKADYRALRRFNRAALRVLPGLALDEISLRRDDAKSSVLQAQMRYTLYLTKPD